MVKYRLFVSLNGSLLSSSGTNCDCHHPVLQQSLVTHAAKKANPAWPCAWLNDITCCTGLPASNAHIEAEIPKGVLLG